MSARNRELFGLIPVALLVTGGFTAVLLTRRTNVHDVTVVYGLIAAHALARGALPVISRSLPYARKDGLAANAGQPDPAVAMVAIVIALIIALLALSWANMFWAALVTALSAVFMAWLAKRQIGGQTGDVLGAAEQVAETAVLLLLAARFG